MGLIGSGMGVGVVFISLLSGALRSSQGDQAWSAMYQVQFSISLLVLVATLLLVRHQQAAPSGGAGFGPVHTNPPFQVTIDTRLFYFRFYVPACPGFLNDSTRR